MPAESGRWQTDLRRAYALLRLTLGLNISFHGAVRWAAGLGGFAHSLLPMFQKAPCLLGLYTGSVLRCRSSKRSSGLP